MEFRLAAGKADMNIRRLIEWIAFAASSTVILYASFAAFDYVLGTGLDNCGHVREAPVTSERGVRAEAMARFCDLIGLPNEKRLGLHLSDDSGDSVLVFYEPRNDRDTPVLRWLDDDHVSVDLGEVTWLTRKSTTLAALRSATPIAAPSRASNRSCPKAASFHASCAPLGAFSGASQSGSAR